MYLDERKTFSKKYGPKELWSVIDHWPLYCGIGNLARAMAIADIVRSTLKVPGHLAEFGSWRGANVLLMAKLLRIFDPHGCKVVHCFDSFRGLTEFTRQDDGSSANKKRYHGSPEELKEIIVLYKMQDEIVIHPGLIEKTLPQLLKSRRELTFSFVYCDTDLYQSTSRILAHVHPRLAKGGVIVFDEWNYDTFPGEGIAANEFLEENGSCYEVEHIQHARQPSLLLRKIR